MNEPLVFTNDGEQGIVSSKWSVIDLSSMTHKLSINFLHQSISSPSCMCVLHTVEYNILHMQFTL